MKKLAFLLLATAAFASCSKNDDSKPVADFAIDGVHDITINQSATSNILPLVISRANTTQETVTLSTSGLPTGISAKFDPNSGTPNFSTILTFSYDYSGTGGTYPVKIVGTTASGKKEYAFNMTVPATPANGWIIDSKAYAAKAFTHDSSYHIPHYYWSFTGISNDNSNSVFFKLADDKPLPKMDKVYKIKAYAQQDDEMQIYVSTDGDDYSPADDATGTVSVTYKDGKFSLRVNTTLVGYPSKLTKTFIANLSE